MLRLTILFLAVFSHGLFAIEEPKYALLHQQDEFEIRYYASHIAASVLTRGNMKSASSSGFRGIADYIFGNNQHLSSGQSENISMTAPVSMQLNDQQAALNTDALNNQQDWQVSFFMPAAYQLDTLPTPNNPDVKLHTVDSYHAAVILFSGLAGPEKVAKKSAALQQWIKKNALQIEGKPQLARYNPPWTLPFLRRNEIIIAIAKPELE